MTSAQVVETSVTTTDNSSSQDYTHPEDQTTLLQIETLQKKNSHGKESGSSMSGLLFRTCRFLSKNQVGELPSTIFVNLTKLEALWVEMEILKS